MRNWIIICLLVIPNLAWAVTPPTEDLMKIGVGARPMGMGKAFVAVADDGNSVFMNPAGLASLKTWQFTSMYVNMLEGDVPYTVLSGSYPLKTGNLGFGLIATGTSGIPSPGSQSISCFDYYDRLFFLSYAADAKKLFRGKDVSLGGNFKIFSKGFTGSYTNTGLGFDFDLGLKYAHNKWLTLGANLQNILPTYVNWTSGSQDDIPALLKLGSAIKVFGGRATMALDADVSLGRSLPTPLHLGLEWPINQVLILRTGLDQIISAASRLSTNPTVGVGFNFRGFKLDYAYHPYQETSLDIAHFVSFSFSPELKKIDALPLPSTPEAAAEPIIPMPVKLEIRETPAPIAKPVDEVEKKYVYHYVSRGETIFTISRKYYGNARFYKDIARLNNIKNVNRIVSGRYLKIDLTLKEE
ncbi:MAG: PorV/PorQ family protein [Candidatus Margulisiibacteriota bacterium]